MEITKENLLYRFTVVAWFILGVLFGGLAMRVVDMWEISKLKTQEEYMCHKGVAYKTMGDGEETIYIKTNLQCLGD